ncbi:hypothetical protein PoB_006940300 [Plakobranchus ocellatus]|uniref:Uncharacterized protein n=1 Tax=Plakobranchus ocellatus TaxID=259542 RepID=A0AAV4DF90_9GAST|nr:hypothetical protein PoB_006940300 [Plakobranchus ocellatus]
MCDIIGHFETSGATVEVAGNLPTTSTDSTTSHTYLISDQWPENPSPVRSDIPAHIARVGQTRRRLTKRMGQELLSRDHRIYWTLLRAGNQPNDAEISGNLRLFTRVFGNQYMDKIDL